MGLVHESRRRAELVNRFRSHVPPLPPGEGPARAPRRLEVFGVGTSWVQLTWSALGPGPVEVRAGDAIARVDADGGPGAVVLEGLAPASSHALRVGYGLLCQVAARVIVPQEAFELVAQRHSPIRR